MMKELPILLELLKHLFSEFNYKLDKERARELTIEEAINKLDKGKCFVFIFFLTRSTLKLAVLPMFVFKFLFRSSQLCFQPVKSYISICIFSEYQSILPSITLNVQQLSNIYKLFSYEKSLQTLNLKDSIFKRDIEVNVMR